MAEGTYEYECMRAELLGVDPPNREIFEADQKVKREAELEEIEKEHMIELQAQQEQTTASGGKMDELNSILNRTQHKIAKFKQVCGSLTNLLKIRSTAETDEHKAAGGSTSQEDGGTEPLLGASSLTDEDKAKIAATKTEPESKTDALDSLISKAERAEMSMAEQNKQMKKFLQ